MPYNVYATAEGRYARYLRLRGFLALRCWAYVPVYFQQYCRDWHAIFTSWRSTRKSRNAWLI